MKNNIPVITIDGPSGSGKGTISFLLAEILGWHFLDSGAIYRVLAYAALKEHLTENAVAELTKLAANLALRFQINSTTKTTQIFYAAEDVTEIIRDEVIGVMASKIAVHASVRAALLQKQRDFQQQPGLVTDGRDMGTVVFPNATHKFFLSASLEERAMRRFKQLQQKGEKVSYENILADLTTRDVRDKERAIAPLKPAEDSILIDTTGLSINEVLQQVLTAIGKAN